MTKKHFERFAGFIRVERAAALRMSDGPEKDKQLYAVDQTQEMVTAVISSFVSNFDKGRFALACQPVKK